MNYLAHQYLSGDNIALRIGNFIGDFVKGNKWQNYPIAIQHGILLHRSIDDFTDNHRTVRESINILRPSMARYAAIANDIFFDHFLAKHWSNFSSSNLKEYSEETYKIINSNIEQLPANTAFVLQYMQQQNWLYNYQFIEGIEKTMNGMSRRTKQPVFENSHLILLENYEGIKSCFDIFFPLLQSHVQEFVLNIKP